MVGQSRLRQAGNVRLCLQVAIRTLTDFTRALAGQSALRASPGRDRAPGTASAAPASARRLVEPRVTIRGRGHERDPGSFTSKPGLRGLRARRHDAGREVGRHPARGHVHPGTWKLALQRGRAAIALSAQPGSFGPLDCGRGCPGEGKHETMSRTNRAVQASTSVSFSKRNRASTTAILYGRCSAAITCARQGQRRPRGRCPSLAARRRTLLR